MEGIEGTDGMEGSSGMGDKPEGTEGKDPAGETEWAGTTNQAKPSSRR